MSSPLATSVTLAHILSFLNPKELATSTRNSKFWRTAVNLSHSLTGFVTKSRLQYGNFAHIDRAEISTYELDILNILARVAPHLQVIHITYYTSITSSFDLSILLEVKGLTKLHLTFKAETNTNLTLPDLPSLTHLVLESVIPTSYELGRMPQLAILEAKSGNIYSEHKYPLLTRVKIHKLPPLQLRWSIAISDIEIYGEMDYNDLLRLYRILSKLRMSVTSSNIDREMNPLTSVTIHKLDLRGATYDDVGVYYGTERVITKIGYNRIIVSFIANIETLNITFVNKDTESGLQTIVRNMSDQYDVALTSDPTTLRLTSN